VKPDVDLDRLVRQTLNELAADARPAPLLAATTRRARRIQRRRVATTAAAAAVLAVLAVLVLPINPDRENRPAPAHPTPSPSASPSVSVLPVSPAPDSMLPPQLPGQFTIMAVPAFGGDVWLFDRVTGAYVTVPYAYVLPAPKGDLVLASTRDGGSVLLDLSDWTVVSLPPSLADTRTDAWSPDATMLLPRQQTVGRIQVYEVAGGNTIVPRVVPYDAAALGCDREEPCPVAWARSGTELAVPVLDPATGMQRSLQLISIADGRPTRRLPVTGEVDGACSWSTDQRYVLNHRILPTGSGGWVITDTTSGATVGTLTHETLPNPSSLCWVSPTELLVATVGEVLVLGPDGKVRQTIDTFAGPSGRGPWVRIGHR
jgi:hypothetical protein